MMKSQLSHFLEMRSYGIKVPKSCPIVTFASGKGGVGKSSLIANLAVTLGKTHRILLVDGDPGMADLHILLGTTPSVGWGHFLRGELALAQCISKNICGIHLLHGFSGLTQLDLGSAENIRRILMGIGELSADYDLILIDSGAGINETNLALTTCADLALLIINSDFTSLADAYGALKTFWQFRGDLPVEVLVNRVRNNETPEGIHQSFSGVTEKFLKKTPPLLGSFKESRQWAEALLRQKPLILLDKTSSSAQEMIKLTETIKKKFF